MNGSFKCPNLYEMRVPARNASVLMFLFSPLPRKSPSSTILESKSASCSRSSKAYWWVARCDQQIEKCTCFQILSSLFLSAFFKSYSAGMEELLYAFREFADYPVIHTSQPRLACTVLQFATRSSFTSRRWNVVLNDLDKASFVTFANRIQSKVVGKTLMWYLCP